MRRTVTFGSAAAATVGAILFACSSFSPTDDASAADGGPDSTAVDGSSETATGSCNGAKIASDPKNCGACGHDCLGGACTGGTCAPVQLGSSSDAPILEVVVDATRVLWAAVPDVSGAIGQLYACPKAGCSGPPAVIRANVRLRALASDGVTAYASSIYGSHDVVRIEPSGSITKLPLPDHVFVGQIAVRKEGVLYEAFDEPASDAGYNRSIYLWDGSVETPAAVYTPAIGANTAEMAVTQDHIYLGAHNTGQLVSCTKNNCSAWTLVSADPNALITSMATDGQRVFWTNDGPLRSCAADGLPCAITDELGPMNLQGANAVTVNYASGALYITTDAGDIFTCKPGGCATSLTKVVHEKKLAQTFPFDGHTVTADDRAVYWAAMDETTAPTTYRIMRIAK